MVEAYHDAGFSGIAITDHMYPYILPDLNNDWNAYIDFFIKGYNNAKKRGDELGIAVILGMELSFTGAPGIDYLVYGFEETFLRENPFITDLGIKEFFRRFGEELLIIQAHPFRYGVKKASTDYVHGVEVYNGNQWHDCNNEKTQSLHKAQPDLYAISASDAHSLESIGTGWIELQRPIADSYQFADIIRNREYTLGKT